MAQPDKVGYPAAPFELMDVNGLQHRLDEFVGSWLLMVFHRHLA